MTATAPTTAPLTLTIAQKDLVKALKTASRVVPSKPHLPVLHNVWLSEDGGALRIVASNLVQTLITWLPGVWEDPDYGMALTIPAKLLTDFVDSLDGGELTLQQQPGTSTVVATCGRYTAKLNGLAADDFPALPTVESDTTLRLPAKMLRKAIGQVAFATAMDDTRPVLASVLVKTEGETLTLAAADGFRLAVRTVALGATVAQPITLLIPGQSLRELLHALPDTDDEVELAAAGSWAAFTWPHGRLLSRLIEGQFPDYARIIPTDPPTRITVPKAELLASVATARVFSRDNSGIVRMAVIPEDDDGPTRLRVDSSSAELGDQTNALTVALEGEPCEIAFNGHFLNDAIDALDGPEVVLGLSGPTTPGLVTALGSESQIQVVMPMHVAR